MKRLSVVLTIASLATLMFASPVGGSLAFPFTGNWIGQDPAPPAGDGSTLFLSMSGGDDVTITFTDLRGNICVSNGAPTDVFRSQLSGMVVGDMLHSTFQWARCGSVTLDWLVGVHVVYAYDAGSDTLSDGFATFYRR